MIDKNSTELLSAAVCGYCAVTQVMSYTDDSREGIERAYSIILGRRISSFTDLPAGAFYSLLEMAAEGVLPGSERFARPVKISAGRWVIFFDGAVLPYKCATQQEAENVVMVLCTDPGCFARVPVMQSDPKKRVHHAALTRIFVAAQDFADSVKGLADLGANESVTVVQGVPIEIHINAEDSPDGIESSKLLKLATRIKKRFTRALNGLENRQAEARASRCPEHLVLAYTLKGFEAHSKANGGPYFALRGTFEKLRTRDPQEVCSGHRLTEHGRAPVLYFLQFEDGAIYAKAPIPYPGDPTRCPAA